MKSRRRILIVISLSILLVIVLGALCFTIALDIAYQPDLDKLPSRDSNVTVLDSNDKPLNPPTYVSLQEVSPYLSQAFIAVEDKRFYSHHGLDYLRIASAAIKDVKNRNFAEGASTITCQLIKNTQLNNEKTISRKLKEAILAKKLEKVYTKDQILESYLNAIYFGNGLYGVGSCASAYFDKSPDKLSIAESASIAAIVANPSKFSPITQPENNLKRRNMIIDLMRDQKFITSAQAEDAKAEKLETKKNQKSIDTSFWTQTLKQAAQILNVEFDTVKMSDYVIYTYCNSDEQQTVMEALLSNDTNCDKTLLFTDPSSGGIVAYASSHNYSPFSLYRQPGSILKPLITAKAFENGFLLPSSPIMDEHINVNGYSPKNYGDIYRGKITVREALAYSSNVCAVKICDILGIDKAADFLESLGFDIPSQDRTAALSLGGLQKGVTPIQLAQAYGVMAAGELKELSFIRRIEDRSGKVLFFNEPKSVKPLSDDTIAYTNDCLKSCVEYGTAKKLNTIKNVCAKTGSVERGDGNSDIWCVAYNSGRVYLAWMGNLSMENDKMLSQTGGGGCGLTLRQAISSTPNNYKAPNVTAPKGRLDLLSYERDGVLRLASANTPIRYTIYDYIGNVKEVSDYFTKPKVKAQCIASENSLEIIIDKQKECVYEIKVISENGISSQLLDNRDSDQKTYFNDLYGLVEIYITPYSKGIRTARGQPYYEKLYF